MIRTGKLTIDALNTSRLGGTPLAEAPLANDSLSRATIFLRQERQLNHKETIWVEGSDGEFRGESVIVMTDAGRVVQAVIALGAGDGAIALVGANASGARLNFKAAKKGSEKQSDGSRSSARVLAAKKSGDGRTAAKRATKKSAKKTDR